MAPDNNKRTHKIHSSSAPGHFRSRSLAMNTAIQKSSREALVSWKSLLSADEPRGRELISITPGYTELEPSLFVELLCGQLICLRMKNGQASAKLQNPVPIPELHDDVPCGILLEFGLAWTTINKKTVPVAFLW